MDKHINHWLIVLGLVAVGISTTSLAATKPHSCPSNIEQNNKGYWVSNDPPEWKSHRPTTKDVTLSAKKFGGVVYSPKKKRLACVYKASNKKWVALLSSVYHPVNEDDLIGSAWQYNQKHKDYVCGKPKHSLKDCLFNIKKN